MKYFLVLILLQQLACASAIDPALKKFREQATRVSIIRDQWGVPHIYGKSNADVVFGVMYAQCEDDFSKVEGNYIERLGRLAEISGESKIFEDLQMRLLYDTADAISDYKKCEPWLKEILQAFTDGINYYIYLHPEKPLLLKTFEPWFPLMFTDGGYTATQTGGLGMNDLLEMYNPNGAPVSTSALPAAPSGSNGFAISPSKSASKNALLYINPHVSFFFRTEMHMVSEEGLNAYGAVTWGQFFVFQGFNENCGWMHTSSLADAADVYEEKITRDKDRYFYSYDGQLKPMSTKDHLIHYKKDSDIKDFFITTYSTGHGPVMGKRGNTWLSLREQNRSIKGLVQSWKRMVAKNLTQFQDVLQLKANNSTNTLYADNKGNIAYWHGNFIPERDRNFDWSQPVDGSVSATEWKAAHDLDQIVHYLNPENGWLQNCNSSPFSASGFGSRIKKNYPFYMAPEDDNFRSIHAIKQLTNTPSFTAESLAGLGYDHYLPAFDSLLPPLIMAYDNLLITAPQKRSLQEPINFLKQWDKRSGVASVATTLAVEWAYSLLQQGYQDSTQDLQKNEMDLYASFAKNTSPSLLLNMLDNVVNGLQKYYGNWQTPWGEICRYQRNVSGSFSDDKSSLPVGLGSAVFGSLPSFEVTWAGTKKGYGFAGNSFVAVVEFGPKIKARSIVTGGQSSDPESKNFSDQARMYLDGKFKDVSFYKEDVLKNASANYYPGDK